jgi:hypothetical protein
MAAKSLYHPRSYSAQLCFRKHHAQLPGLNIGLGGRPSLYVNYINQLPVLSTGLEFLYRPGICHRTLSAASPSPMLSSRLLMEPTSAVLPSHYWHSSRPLDGGVIRFDIGVFPSFHTSGKKCDLNFLFALSTAR